MNDSYKPDFSPLDHEERELERLDPSSALPEEAREAILVSHRAEAKKNVTIRISEKPHRRTEKEGRDRGSTLSDTRSYDTHQICPGVLS
jgi:hypothetical protein